MKLSLVPGVASLCTSGVSGKTHPQAGCMHGRVSEAARKVDTRLHGKGYSKLPWRKAGQPGHLVDVVDSDQ